MDELRALDRQMQDVWQRCQNALQDKLGTNFSLQFLPLKDRRRLTTFLVWEQRYRISVEWMVGVLLDIYSKVRKGKKKKVMGFPVSVKTLVSESSEQMVREELAKEFKDGENVGLWFQYEQRRWLNAMYERENLDDSKEKSLLDFAEPRKYRDWYGSRVMDKREWMDRKRQQRKEESRPYRGNPWR